MFEFRVDDLDVGTQLFSNESELKTYDSSFWYAPNGDKKRIPS